MSRHSLAMAVLLFICSTSSAEMQKFEVIDAVKRKAVCNDGSPAIYYFHPGFADGVRRWLILLEGGGFCNDYACSRPPYLRSSLETPDTPEISGGLLSNSSIENPEFHAANKVFIHYCSSDLWSGNRHETRGYRPVQFRGRIILRSIINDLLRNNSSLSESGTEILLTGWSAGGVGVMVNLDWLAKRLPKAKVRGLNDAGWWPVESKTGQDLEKAVAQGIPMWGGKPDHDCVVANRKSKSACYVSTVYPYITTPLFIQESQRDGVYVGAHPAKFAKALLSSLAPVDAAFSPRTNNHGLGINEGFVSVKIDGYSFSQVLGNWFFDRAGPAKKIQK